MLSQAIASKGDAQGGGIWAAGPVELLDTSEVRENRAQSSDGGSAYGGGIYGEHWVDVFDDAGVSNNSLQIRRSTPAPARHGAGVYTQADAVIEGRLIGNFAEDFLPGNGSILYTGGLAIDAKDGLIFRDGARVRDNGQSGEVKIASIINTEGFLQMDRTQVVHNHSFTHIVDPRGDAHISRSTVAENQMEDGASLYLGYAASTPVHISLSTISGNTASMSRSYYGGPGVFLYRDGEILHSTISDNRYTPDDTSPAHGGGIVLGDGVALRLYNTIVAGNLEMIDEAVGLPLDIGTKSGPTGGASITPDSDYNLVGFIQNNTLGLPAVHNILGVEDPQLASLADNGGYTPTRLPLPTSPAINAGDSANTGMFVPMDQRELPRMVGGQADIGAVELTTEELVHGPLLSDGFEDP